MSVSGLRTIALLPLLLVACQTSPKQVDNKMSPDEKEAREFCEDAMPTDVRYAGGAVIFDSCVNKFLYERQRGRR